MRVGLFDSMSASYRYRMCVNLRPVCFTLRFLMIAKMLPLKASLVRAWRKAKLAIFNDHLFEANGIVERLCAMESSIQLLGENGP